MKTNYYYFLFAFLILFFFKIEISLSQNQLDSLQRELKNTHSDTSKVNLYNGEISLILAKVVFLEKKKSNVTKFTLLVDTLYSQN